MTTLGLRLVKNLFGGEDLPSDSGVVAIVHALSEPNKGTYFRQQTVTIPVGLSRGYSELDVPVGRYLVEAPLPNGDVVTQEVQVDGPTNVDIETEDSPHEWLGWQHLVGNVTGRRTHETQTPEAPSSVPTVLWLGDPVPPLGFYGFDGPGRDVWTLLDGVAASDPSSVFSRLSQAPPEPPLAPSAGDTQVQLFRLTAHGPQNQVVELGRFDGRRFLLVIDHRNVTLVALPFPWHETRSGQDAVAEVLVRRDEQQGGWPDKPTVAVSLRDPQFGTLVGYLTQGAFPTAQRLLEPAREMLREKTLNPLAAAAGGYVLVGGDSEPGQQWHDWIANLANSFRWLPDGAIQRARLHLQLARDEKDLDLAHESLREAFGRGLPYFGLGLQWLVDGLAVFAEEDVETAHMHDAVRRVAQRCNLQQPFTVLRLSEF